MLLGNGGRLKSSIMAPKYFLKFGLGYLQWLPAIMLIAKQTIQILMLNISPHNKNLSITSQSFFAFLGCSELFYLTNKFCTIFKLSYKTDTTGR